MPSLPAGTPDTRKVALITGCSHSHSLGYELALDLKHRGWRVFASARNVESEGMRALKGEGIELLELDLNSETSIEAAVREVELATSGKLNLLVNNAGVVSRCPTLETPLSNLREMFETNVFGPLHLIQLCTPALIRTSNNAGGGARVTPKTPGGAMILNVGSTAGEGLIWHIGYAASKAAMNTMSEVLRRETKNLGIEVLTVVPGRIKTFMTQEATDSDSDSEHAQIQTQTQTQTPVPKPAGAEAGAGSESESSNSRFGSLYYPNLSQILAGTSARLARDDNTSSVPTARQVAVKLCNLVERGHGRKVYPGAGGWIFQYVYPWLPLYIQDKLWEQLGQLHLVKRVVI